MEAKFVPVFTLADLEASKVQRAECLRYVDVDHFEGIRNFFESHDTVIAHEIDEQQKECVELIVLWVSEVFRPAVQIALVQHIKEDAGGKWELVELLMVAAALTKYGERELDACRETKDGSQHAFNEGPATLFEEAQESSDYASDDAETQFSNSVYQDGDEDGYAYQSYMRRGEGQHLQDQIEALNERFEDCALRDDQQHYFDELHELNERFDDFMLSLDNHVNSTAGQRPRAEEKEAVQTQHLRVNGLPDRRFRENKAALAPPAPTKVRSTPGASGKTKPSVQREPRARSTTSSGQVHLKQDGTPDGRFKENKATRAGPSARSSSTRAKPEGSGRNGVENGGRTLITGARGGTYYVNGNGNKVYLKK